MVKTILVAHDGGPMSDGALKYALEIAKSMDMKIRLVRIIPEILDATALSFWTEAERRREPQSWLTQPGSRILP